MGFGSYLIWAAYPDYQVFVDPRIELFPFEIWEDYIALSNALPGWEERAGTYGIRTLLLNPDRQALLVAAAEASQNWILAYEDQSAVIFSKVDE